MVCSKSEKSQLSLFVGFCLKWSSSVGFKYNLLFNVALLHALFTVAAHYVKSNFYDFILCFLILVLRCVLKSLCKSGSCGCICILMLLTLI